MPPEAVSGQAIPDIRGDIYSLGVTMYYWATGASPFATGNAYNTLQRVISGQATPLSELRPDLTPGLLGVIRTAMQMAPEQRFQDPQAMLRVLKGDEPVPDDTPTPAEASVPVQPSPAAPPKSVPWTWLIVAMLAVVVLVAGFSQMGVAKAAGGPPSGAVPDHPGGPAAAALASGYRLPWLGDGIVSFQERGAVTYARSGQVVNLPENAWLDGSPAPALSQAMAMGEDFSVELAIHPANLVQEGPARIFSIGLTPRSGDLMIGQSGSRLEVRVRTTVTNPDGTRPHVVSEDGALNGRWQHVAFVRSQRQHILYINGQERARVEVGGILESWDPAYPICVGNDHRGGFPWSGSLGTLVIQGRAWTPEEVTARYRVWEASEQTGPTAR